MTPGVYVVEHKTAGVEIVAGSPYWRRLVLDSQVSNYIVGARALGHEPVGVLYDVVRKVRLTPKLATPEADREYTKPKDKACPTCKRKGAPPAPHQVVLETEADGTELVATCKDGRIVTDPGGELYANLRDKDESLDEYRARVRADIGAQPEKYYQRGLIVRLENEEYAAAGDTWVLAEQLRDTRNRAKKYAERKVPVAAVLAWPRNVNACEAYGSWCEYWAVCSGEASIDDPTRYRTSKEHEELDAEQNDGKVRLPILSTSSARSFAACQRKFFYAYELRRRSITDAIALRFGTVFHIALEAWWTTVDLALALGAMRAAYAKQEIDPVEAIKAEELMLGYHVRWQHEPLRVLAVEAEFRAALVNPETDSASKTFQRGGKIDAIVHVDGASAAVTTGGAA